METMKALIQKHQISMLKSETAVREHPDEFSEIRKILNRVVLEPVDIDAYYPLAEKLARLLEAMGPETIFSHYFTENIDPKRGCQARYFRFMCLDLTEQINHLMQRRGNRRRLRLM
jgi:hypothetical protein